MEQNRFRCHISIILNKVAGLIVFAAILIYNNLSEVVKVIKSGRLPEGKMLFVLGILVVVTVVYAIWNFMRWFKTWIMFENESIVIERNTLNRKVNTIGMKNISNVNLEQNLFQRVIHVYQVKLDTNSASTANSTDVDIVLSEKMARAFQKNVLAHLGQEQMEFEEKAEHPQEITYTGAQLVKHCLSTLKISWLLLGIATMLTAIIGLREQVDEISDLLDMLAAIIAILVFLGTTIWNLVGDYFRLYDFRAYRSGRKLYLSYGLFNKKEYIIPVEKINAVVIHQNLMARILKRQYVELVCIGLGDEKQEGTQIMLASTKEELEANMQLLLPEYANKIHISLEKQPISVIMTKIPGYLVQVIICAACAIGAYMLKPEWLLGEIMATVAVLVIRVIREMLWYKTTGLFCDENGLAIANGVFSKRITYLDYYKMQTLKMNQGPFRRKYDLYQGTMHILADKLSSVYETGSYPEEVFEQIHQGMLRKN